MRPSFVPLSTTVGAAVVAAAAFGLVGAGLASAAAPSYTLMVKAPSPSNTAKKVKAAKISVNGKERRCVPFKTYKKYTDAKLSVRRGDKLEAGMFTKTNCSGFIGGEAMKVKSKNIKNNKVWFNLNP